MDQHHSFFQLITNPEKSFIINIPRFRTVEIKQTCEILLFLLNRKWLLHFYSR